MHKKVKYQLTPSRKNITKSVDRGSQKAVAMRDQRIKKYLMNKYGSTISSDVATLCSERVNSRLKSMSKDL